MEGEHCQFFVIRKKRYCRMTVKKGNKFCGEHQQNQTDIKEEVPTKKRRITCPLDSTQSVFYFRINLSLFLNYIKFMDYFQYLLRS